MQSKSFDAKIGYVGSKKRENKSLIIHIPVAVSKLLKLKLGGLLKVVIKKWKLWKI